MDSNESRINIVIIGASSGLGKEIAIQYSKNYNVCLLLAARRNDKLQEVVNQIADCGNKNVKGVKMDITVEEDCKALFDYAEEFLGVIDVLILNAGVGMNCCFSDIENVDDFDIIMDTNFWGIVNCLYYAIPHIEEKACNKTKVFITSTDLIINNDCGIIQRQSLYIASKKAIDGYVDSLFKEGIQFPISIVYLSAVCTDFYNKLIQCDGKVHQPELSNTTYPECFLQTSNLMPVEKAAEKYICAIQSKDRPDCKIFLDKYNRLSNYFRPFSKKIADCLSNLSCFLHFNYGHVSKYKAPLIYLNIYNEAKNHKKELDKYEVGSDEHTNLLINCCKKVGSLISLHENHSNILDPLPNEYIQSVINAQFNNT
jgi:short-subunit dehydrogenase